MGASAPPHIDALAALLTETARGDERAFARVYELIGARLLAVARAIIGRTDLAEDVVQESFLRVWRLAHRFDPHKSAAQASLVTIVRNRALSMKASLRRHDDNRVELDADKIAFDGPDAASQMMRSDEARRVNACLANLPINHRRSLLLVYFEGPTHVKLAARLKVPAGTAKAGCGAGWAKSANAWSAGPAPLALWSRIEQEVSRGRASFSPPSYRHFFLAALAGLAITALVLLLR